MRENSASLSMNFNRLERTVNSLKWNFAKKKKKKDKDVKCQEIRELWCKNAQCQLPKLTSLFKRKYNYFYQIFTLMDAFKRHYTIKLKKKTSNLASFKSQDSLSRGKISLIFSNLRYSTSRRLQLWANATVIIEHEELQERCCSYLFSPVLK